MSEWIVDRLPTAEDADEGGSVIAWIDDCWSEMSWKRVADERVPWMLPPEPYVPPEQFADGATYSNQKLWVDADGYLWKVPTNPDSNLHFARCEGVCKSDGSLIWVAYASELPGDCVLYTSYENPPIDTSLAASIERVGKTEHGTHACPEQAIKPMVCSVCDRNRVWEAAKLELLRQVAKAQSDQEDHQPQSSQSFRA